ncbi:hypothetical protein RhiJN_07663 [Ceratobasidium sp. AG-Ba]|nr:hypothetical protein RhiJN_07663 [Ceratobasidium sp. AG-Ba]QRW08506.1 hypothetical protein RhiLY_07505 [Ceratobasidium sp. AG-Ba]
MDYSFPPKPASKHLELQRPSTGGEPPEPAPPLPHAGGYMDIVGFRKSRRPTTSQTSPERRGTRLESTSPERKDVGEDPTLVEKKGVQLPWDKKHGRSQSGIANGLATTLKFGAAAVPAEAVAQFQSSREVSPRKSGDK